MQVASVEVCPECVELELKLSRGVGSVHQYEHAKLVQFLAQS